MRTAFRRTIRRAAKAPQWMRLVYRAVRQSERPDFAATSMDLCDNPGLAAILGVQPSFYSRLLRNHPDTIIGWGRKWSGQRAVALAGANTCKLRLLEDGFIRSLKRHDHSCAIVMDDCGIYYDASTPSALERCVARPLSSSEAARIDHVLRLWRDNQVSKYNSAPDYQGKLPEQYVLVVDQVKDDLSITYGAADHSTFTTMLQAARTAFPDMQVIVKMHPDVLTHNRKGHFDLDALAKDPQVQVIAENCHPVRLIAQASAVYTVSSQIGFEALIWGKPVRCFGMPFYAGYGLTTDELPAPERRVTASLQQLAHAALCEYSCYYDPQSGGPSDVETIIARIGLQRRSFCETSGRTYALGFSRWKRPFLRRFLPEADIAFVTTASAVPQGATVAIWGSRQIDDLPKDAKILRIEDGFLRSSGLGAALIAPLSWVIDDQGIYYDPRTPSRLETLLQAHTFAPSDLERATQLVRRIRSHAISKYNLGGKRWTRPATQDHVILVPGQVEADASIRFGAPQVATNHDLLRAVRSENPDAYIVYKPHPDVVAGLRRAGKSEMAAAECCDEIATDVDITTMWDQIDAVHTMTSLAGFEALLRDLDVTCYGQPFYAGWGLTNDIVPLPRRRTKLTLEELVAGALIAYPRYVSLQDHRITTPERAISDLMQWQADGPGNTRLWRAGRRAMMKTWVKSGLRKDA